MTDGVTANLSGNRAEKTIACMLKERGYSFKRQIDLGLNIYGHKSRGDFIVYDIPEYPHGLIIESKWQASSGSVDEKYPYMVANIKATYPYPTVIVVSGGGYKSGALTWLKQQVDGKKLIHVFSLEEFLSWMNRELSDPQFNQPELSNFIKMEALP